MGERHKSRAIVPGNLVLSHIRAGALDAALDTFTETVDESHGTRGAVG